MTEDKPAGRFGRWLAAFCASLLESSRMSGVDWTGWRVDWEVCSRHADAGELAGAQRLRTRWR
jgi:hypothetical protein